VTLETCWVDRDVTSGVACTIGRTGVRRELSSGVVKLNVTAPQADNAAADLDPDAVPPFGRSSRALAHAIVRWRAWIAAFWVIAFLALAPVARHVKTALDVAGNRTGESAASEVERRLAIDFASPFARYALLVITGIPSVDSGDGRVALQEIASTVGHAPGVSRTASYLSTRDTAFLSSHGTFMVVGLHAPPSQADDWILGLRAVSGALQHRLRARYPNATLAWTGNAALNYDVRSATADDAARAEHRIVPVTLVLLLLVFGSVVAACVPLLAAGLAIILSLGIAVLLAYAHWPLSIVLRNTVSMLGLGAGIDYALLVVSRFREGLAEHHTPVESAELALCHAGHTVMLSATAVVISFAALLIVPASELRSIATGGLIVVATGALVATTLLPGLLAWLGPRIDAFRLPLPRRMTSATSSGRVHPGWRAWGAWASAHPWSVLALGGVPLVILGSQAQRLNANLPSGDWLPRHAESTMALRSLGEMGKSGLVQTLRIVIQLPAGSGVLTPVGWEATRHATARLAADPRIALVRSLPSVTGAVHPSPTFITLLPTDALRTFTSRNGREAIVEVVPREGVPIGALVNLAREIRLAGPAALTGDPDATVLVGGLPAFNAEYQDQVRAHITTIVILVVAGSFLTLLIGFRSVLVPVKAIILNLLSVAAAFGAAVLVFQDGHGIGLLGLATPIDGLFPAVPLVVFCLVFGFSMDYEVFLVARVAEAAAGGADDETAVADGVARTGGVITSAAAIMVVVFAAFALSDFLLIKILGFTLAIAILIDATLVRMAVGPALLRLAGRWNWWPGR
jgi:putative drug exporter of the RND superfamily